MLQLVACLFSATILSSTAYAADTRLLAQANTDNPPVEAAAASYPAASRAPQEGGIITLDAAIQRALAHSPRLKASASAALASKGERRQAGLWANPEASVGAENVGGKGAYRGIDSAEITYGVSQLIEIGGKRSARVNVAEQGMTLAGFDYQAARLDLIRDVQLAYTDAIAAQEQVEITKEQQTLAKEVLDVVSQRVGAAREPLIQQSKAEVTFSSSTIANDKARRALVTAERNLAALWGDGVVHYKLDNAAFFSLSKPAPIAGTPEMLKKNPDFARFDAELAKSRAALDLEKANAVPDPRVNAGIRDIRVSNDRAFVVGLSLPIPVLNRNQGNIEKAYQDINRTESMKGATSLSLSTDLTRAQAELDSSYHQAITLKSIVLPAAKKAFNLSRQGYGAGKFSYLEVLDAQRTLYETRAQYHDALRDYHRSRADVERLTAAHLATSNHNEESHD